MSLTLLSSPLQGLTDFRFRNAFNSYFDGIDAFYAPYIRLKGELEIKPGDERDLAPENNTGITLIPQILTKDADAFIFMARYVQNLGYRELNWNLGCPYPMVTRRGLGSGLLKNPAKIDSILDQVFKKSDIPISIKMRLGDESDKDILEVLPVLEKYPLKYIIIHPRIAKQLYREDPDLDAFQKCIENTGHKLYYNGNITSVDGFNKLKNRFSTIDHFLIGRGMIADPFLPGMIKNNTLKYPENRIDLFRKFHDRLFEDYTLALSGPGHILMKMVRFWEYFILSFPDAMKGLKKIKKAKTTDAYKNAVEKLWPIQ